MADTTEPRLVVGLSAQPLDTAALVREIERDDCGAVVTFEGRVRSPNHGHEVVELFYEAYEERALAQLRGLAESASERHGLGGVVAVHRTGSVRPGEPAVVVAVTSPHRQESFAAASWLIDIIKAEVSIWKKEVSPDGSEWVRIDDCGTSTNTSPSAHLPTTAPALERP